MTVTADYTQFKPDFHYAHAIRRIYDQYGHMASLSAKNKSLSKFGKCDNCDSGVRTTVWNTANAAIGGPALENFETSNDIDTISSSNAGDTQTIVYEGHTISNGLLTFFVDEVTLQGQTPVTLPTAGARINRMRLKSSGDWTSPTTTNAGVIYAYSSGGGQSAGVPTVKTDIHAVMLAGENSTEKAATSISKDDYWLLDGIVLALGRGNANTVTCDFDVEIRDVANGGVWTPVGIEVTLRANSVVTFRLPFEPVVIVPPNHDVRVVAISNTNNTSVAARMRGYLAKIVN